MDRIGDFVPVVVVAVVIFGLGFFVGSCAEDKRHEWHAHDESPCRESVEVISAAETVRLCPFRARIRSERLDQEHILVTCICPLDSGVWFGPSSIRDGAVP